MDRLQEIRARLDLSGTYNPHGPDNAHFIAHAPADIAWLLDEVEKWRERAERQNPVIEVRGDDGSVWVRIDGVKAPSFGGTDA